MAVLRRKITKRRDYPDAYEINITPVMNLFICLIPFLLMSAIFVQLAVIETDAPAVGAGSSEKDTSMIMVVIDKRGIVVSGVGPIVKNVKDKSQRISKRDGKYDFDEFRRMLVEFKVIDPEAKDLLLMAHPKIPYSTLVEIMDTARSAEDGADLFPGVFFGGVTS